MDQATLALLKWLAFALVGGTFIALVTSRMADGSRLGRIGRAAMARFRMIWAMCFVMAAAILTGRSGSVIVFGLSSFLLLREFMTITPTRRADHPALFWVFFVILPLQYFALYIGWYGLFIMLIPVYAFLLIPMRILRADDPTHFMERTAKIQWGMMLCIYSISHTPALIKLAPAQSPYEGLRLLLFLTTIVQVHDLIQDVMTANGYGRKIFVKLAAGESFESFTLAVVASALAGVAFAPVVPFSRLQAAAMGMAIAITAFFGRLCWVAIQQDRGRKGVVVVRARPLMTERMISLCFAAPLFFHLTRFFFYGGDPAQF